MKRALGLAMLGLFLLAQPVAASDYTASGRAKANDRLIVVVTTSVAGDITATAAWSGSTRYGFLWLHNADDSLRCYVRADFGPPLACTIPNAPAGDYTAEFWGWTQVKAVLTVHTSD